MSESQQMDLHPILKDLENTFSLFILANTVLADPEVQNRAEAKPEIKALLEAYNSWIQLKIEVRNGAYTSKANLLHQMIFLGKAISVLMYDILIYSKYQGKICKLEIYQFLKFIRDGAAHGNRFSLCNKRGEILGENKKVTWRGKEIVDRLGGDDHVVIIVYCIKT